MKFKFEKVKESLRVREDYELVSYGHGAFGEPDNNYRDYKYVYVGEKRQEVSDAEVLVIDEEENVVDVLTEYSVRGRLREMLFPETVERDIASRKRMYEQLKAEFE